MRGGGAEHVFLGSFQGPSLLSGGKFKAQGGVKGDYCQRFVFFLSGFSKWWHSNLHNQLKMSHARKLTKKSVVESIIYFLGHTLKHCRECIFIEFI